MPTGAVQAPQAVDPELRKMTDQFMAAWAKGDAAAIAALYMTDAIYINSQNELMLGRSAIEIRFGEWFKTEAKGSTISIIPGQVHQITPDMVMIEGTWKIEAPQTLANLSISGRYLNTAVRQQGQWRIAGSATVGELRPSR